MRFFATQLLVVLFLAVFGDREGSDQGEREREREMRGQRNRIFCLISRLPLNSRCSARSLAERKREREGERERERERGREREGHLHFKWLKSACLEGC